MRRYPPSFRKSVYQMDAKFARKNCLPCNFPPIIPFSMHKNRKTDKDNAGNCIFRMENDSVPPHINGANAPIDSHSRPAMTLAGRRAMPASVECRPSMVQWVATPNVVLFQSTLPVGGATIRGIILDTVFVDFNPRSPWGERPALAFAPDAPEEISIHAPRGGSDTSVVHMFIPILHFNPRSPWGERHGQRICSSITLRNFNPRSPWGERLPARYQS